MLFSLISHLPHICNHRTFVLLHNASLSVVCVSCNNWVPPWAQQGRTRPIMACRCSRGDQLLLRGLRAGSRVQAAGASILPLHTASQLEPLQARPSIKSGGTLFPAAWSKLLSHFSNSSSHWGIIVWPLLIWVTAVSQFVVQIEATLPVSLN